jgi:hypothetical protein
MFLAFMTPFNVVTVGILWAVWHSARRHRRTSPAGGFKIASHYGQTHVRLTELSPGAAAFVAMGVCAFFSVFVVAFVGGGFHPTLQTMSWVWALIIGSAIGAGLILKKRINAGRYDLIIDALSGEFSLPLTEGRKTRQKKHTSTVASIEVATLSTDSEHLPMYAVDIVYSGPNSRTERLGKWADIEQANWL